MFKSSTSNLITKPLALSGFTVSALIGLSAFSPASNAAALGQYTFTNNLTATGVSANVSFDPFVYGTVTPVSSTTDINASNWATSGFDTSKYYQFTVTPSSGYTLTLESLVFDARRSGNGPTDGSVRSSLDGYATNIGTFTPPTNNNTNQTVNLSSFTNISAPLSFRIYGFNAGQNNGTMRLDNVTLNGSVASAVPEPLTILGAVTAAGFGACFKRRLAKSQNKDNSNG